MILFQRYEPLKNYYCHDFSRAKSSLELLIFKGKCQCQLCVNDNEIFDIGTLIAATLNLLQL